MIKKRSSNLAAGFFSLAATIVCAPGYASASPTNDNFPGTTLQVNPGTLTGQTNVGATVEAGEPTDFSSSKSVWYAWTPAISAQVQLNTCGARTFDTTLAVYQGSAVNALTSLASNDDACGLGSRVTFAATAGQTYYFRFGGFVSGEGTADIYWGFVKSISALSVDSGPLAGGTEVTITGIGFTDTTSVTFGGIAGTNLVVVDDTTVRVTTPAGAAEGAVDVQVIGPGGTETRVSGFTYLPAGTPRTEFEADEDEIRQILVDDASRALRSTLEANRALSAAARERMIYDNANETPSGDIPLDVDASVETASSTISTKGTFFGKTQLSGSVERLVFGRFDVQHDTQSGTSTATVHGRVAWEHAISDQERLGYFIGGEVAQSNISEAYEGELKRAGVIAGGYVVRELEKQVYLDGFFSIGAGMNNIDIDNSVLALTGDYVTKSATVGVALSSVIEQQGFEIWPELSLSVGRTWIGDVTFTGSAYDQVDNNLSLDAGYVTLAQFMFRPEFRIPLDGQSGADSLQLAKIAPRLACEKIQSTETESSCGAGAEVSLTLASEDGLSNFSASLLSDRFEDHENTSVQLNLQHKF